MKTGQTVYAIIANVMKPFLTECEVISVSVDGDIEIKEKHYSFNGLKWAKQDANVTYFVNVDDLDKIFEDLTSALNRLNHYTKVPDLHKEENCTKDLNDIPSPLSAGDVELQFMARLLTIGTATTLEVKLELREMGFDARQAFVSDVMSKMAENLSIPYDIDEDNNHRIYYSLAYKQATELKLPENKREIDVIDNKLKMTPLKPWTHVTRHGKEITGYIFDSESPAKPGDWLVAAPTKAQMWFSGIHTRDEVRNAYAILTKSSFQQTRSSKL